ncbi:granzyme B(G,H)-like [Mastacembelus armatus]|uniref:trypsin n=1 Tax=Mastacembelus armatus TaxID=205130 RepID=A0A3Q3MUI4_9TELE|nr:granzyme B(G,H)-like [Mastacembelus armatus]
MFIHHKLLILILVLSLDGQVQGGKIIGGHKAMPHSRPYMALLEQRTQNVVKYCGAFLLSEDFVMTAAHCQAESYNVILGFHKFSEKEKQNISVDQAFPHKAYNATGYKNDIMLLKLRSKARFNKNVTSIDLADQGDGSLPKSCFVSGWGRNDKNKPHMSRELMEVNVTLIDDKFCALQNFYCSKGETGPAEGDSGGPLVCEDGKAYGVVSSKYKKSLTTYVKISDYRDWIDFIMNI